MNPNNQTPPLGQPSTAEEDVALQAIESLDVEESESPVESTPTVHNPISDIKTAPPSTDESPVASTPATPVSSPANDTLAAANAESSTPTEAFQPFVQQKSPRNPLKLVLIIVLVLVVLGAGGYFGWQYYQSTLTMGSNSTSQQEQSQNTTAPTDTETAVNEDISELETLMQSMTDDELSDDTLSDDALYN